MNNTLKVGMSSCPNDTFVFHAAIHALVDTCGLNFEPHIADVEELNRLAFEKTLPVTKLSFHAAMHLRDSYEILDAGAALGFGCGPMLVGKYKEESLKGLTVAIPGKYTTAALLLKLWNQEVGTIVETRFDKILPGIRSGEFDAGVIIHEGRFVYKNYDCVKIVDLGEWWEQQTGLPIPLGCIAVRKTPDVFDWKEKLESVIRNSVNYAWKHPQDSEFYIRKLAQVNDPKVIQNHIDLYVNEFTESLGDEGRAVISQVSNMMKTRGLLR